MTLVLEGKTEEEEEEEEHKVWAGVSSTNNKFCWTEVVGRCNQYQKITSAKANSLNTSSSH